MIKNFCDNCGKEEDSGDRLSHGGWEGDFWFGKIPITINTDFNRSELCRACRDKLGKSIRIHLRIREQHKFRD